MARRLHDSIRRLLKDGETEPLFIASGALKALEESEPGTPKAESAKQSLLFSPRSWTLSDKRKGQAMVINLTLTTAHGGSFRGRGLDDV